MRSSFTSRIARFKFKKLEEAKKIIQDNDPILKLLVNKGYSIEQVVKIDLSLKQQVADQMHDASRKGIQSYSKVIM